MVGIPEASAAVSGLKAAYDMARGVQALAKDVDLKLATIDLMASIVSAQQSALQAVEAQAEMQKRVAELEAKLAVRDEWDAQRARYKLTTFPTGVMVYVLDPEQAADEPDHKLCPTCFHDGRKSILQVTAKHSGGEIVECQTCQKKLKLSPFPPVQIPTARGIW
jgi:formate dehydrogenase maturation protein FdhE